MSFSASSFHLALGLPLGRFLCKLAWHIFLVFLASSVHCRSLIHLRRGSLIKVAMLMSYNISISVFVLIHPSLSSSTGPKIVLTVFLSKIVFFQLIYDPCLCTVGTTGLITVMQFTLVSLDLDLP